VQPQRLSTQSVDEDVRKQLEATTQQLVETQEQLEKTLRQLAALESQLAEARRQLEETQGQLAETQEQLKETRRQLAESQELLLDNKAWIKLVGQCVSLFDELDRKSVGMDPQRREMAGYICSQLEEILERCGVTIISGDSAFDESRHRPYPAVSRIAAGSAIVQTLSPGFIVGPRVLRRARVRVAEETE